MKEMKTLTLGEDVFEVVDEMARNDVSELKKTLDNRINVLHPPFGLNPLDNKGLIDNSAAFQAIIDYVDSNNLHCSIYFPSGTYLFNSSITINCRNLQIVGNIQCTSRILNNSNDYWVKLQGTNGNIVNFVKFRELYIYSTNSMSNGIYIENASYIYIEYCRFVDFVNYITLNDVTGFKLNESLMQSKNTSITDVKGLTLNGNNDSLRVFHTSFAFRGLTGACGIYSAETSRDLSIEYNSFSGCMNSIYIGPTTDLDISRGNVQIIGNFIDDCYGTAIRLQNITNRNSKENPSLVAHNYINAVGNQAGTTPLSLVGIYGSRGINFSDNRIVNLNNIANVEAIHGSQIKNCSVCGNYIENMTCYAIRWANSLGCSIDGNHISSLNSTLSTALIVAGCNACSVCGNVFSNKIMKGINATSTSSHLNVNGNIICSNEPSATIASIDAPDTNSVNNLIYHLSETEI